MSPTFIYSDPTPPMSVRLTYQNPYLLPKMELLIPLTENRFMSSPNLSHLERWQPYPPNCSIQKPKLLFPHNHIHHEQVMLDIIPNSVPSPFPSSHIPVVPSQARWPPWTPGLPPSTLAPLQFFLHVAAWDLSRMSIRSVKSLPCLKPSKCLSIMAIKMKANQTFSCLVRPCMVRPWQPLQAHPPGLSPSCMPYPHCPSPISGPFALASAANPLPPELHMTVSLAFTSQLKHALLQEAILTPSDEARTPHTVTSLPRNTILYSL